MKKLIFPFLAVLIFTGCYYDKKSELFPGYGLNPCDTTSVMTYSQHVEPILSSYCYSCHSGHTPSSGIDLSTWSNVSTYAGTGQLMGCIKHSSGYNPMPPTGSLDQCKIRQIEIWVNAGSPNN